MIRTFELADKEQILAMVSDFYSGPGVLHPIPVQHFSDAFAEMVLPNGRLRGLAVFCGDTLAGYSLLAFEYSVEAGGEVVWVEDLYIKPCFRSHGLGKEVFAYIKQAYAGKATRLRLELMPQNARAHALYQSMGFEDFPYTQMIFDFDA